MVRNLQPIISLFFFGVLTACSGTSKTLTAPVSNIKSDEFVVFFRTAAWMDRSEKYWNVPIHGWIYEPERSVIRKSIFSEALKLKYDLEANKNTEDNFNRRVNLLIADNERGKEITISIGGRIFTLPPSEPNGHFSTVIKIPTAFAKSIARNNLITYTAVTKKGEKRIFLGQVQLLSKNGISVISDIDDTVKISHVTDHKKLFDHTFFKDFIEVPKMSALYRKWSSQQVAIHFVSSSPWQLYSPLLEFTEEADFPWATFNLKLVRFRDKSVLNLFKKGTETKPRQIEPLLTRYPHRKFILVGDSGEQDPEVYAGVMHRHPDQILKIYIRNVSKASADDSRFRSVFAEIGKDKWQLFTDPSTLNLN